jgi:hypothetical protein
MSETMEGDLFADVCELRFEGVPDYFCCTQGVILLRAKRLMNQGERRDSGEGGSEGGASDGEESEVEEEREEGKRQRWGNNLEEGIGGDRVGQSVVLSALQFADLDGVPRPVKNKNGGITAVQKVASLLRLLSPERADTQIRYCKWVIDDVLMRAEQFYGQREHLPVDSPFRSYRNLPRLREMRASTDKVKFERHMLGQWVFNNRAISLLDFTESARDTDIIFSSEPTRGGREVIIRCMEGLQLFDSVHRDEVFENGLGRIIKAFRDPDETVAEFGDETLLAKVNVMVCAWNKPRQCDLYMAVHMVEYIYETRTTPLVLGGPVVDIEAWSDASLGTEEDLTSSYGHVIATGPDSGAVITTAKSTSIVVTDIFQAEIFSAHVAANEMRYILGAVNELKPPNQGPKMLNRDSETTDKHPRSEKPGKSRHMLLRHQDLVNRVKRGETNVRTIEGVDNKLDMMTKQLVGKEAAKYLTEY